MVKGTGKLVFLDTEATGLLEHHQIWEIAWAVNKGSVFSAIVPHTVVGADEFALEIGNYYERRANLMELWNPEAEEVLYHELQGATIVASNPTFDAEKFQKRWGVRDLWHHRMIDLESYALGRLWKDDQMRGQYQIAEELIRLGYDVPLPDHSAGNDVKCLQACFYTLKENF